MVGAPTLASYARRMVALTFVRTRTASGLTIYYRFQHADKKDNMPLFSFGIWLIYGFAGFPALYLLAYACRYVESYLRGTAPPTDRIIANLVVWSIVGLICGSLWQSQFDHVSQCRQAGQTLFGCLAKR